MTRPPDLRLRRRRALCGALLLLATACTMRDVPDSADASPDAGVPVARMDPPRERVIVDRQWTAVAVAGGPRDDSLFGQPTAVVASADGAYVLDEGGLELFAFDQFGRLRWRTGRKGRGPGEFLRPSDVALLPEGGVAVLDPDNGRISRFDADGRYRDAVSAPELPNAWELCVTRDGRFHVTQPRTATFITTLSGGDRPASAEPFPWRQPAGGSAFLRRAYFARGVPRDDCWLATLHGFGLVHFTPGRPLEVHPFVEHVPPPELEHRKLPQGGMGTYLASDLTASRTAFRSGDTVFVLFQGAAKESIADLYGPDGAYLATWRMPPHDRFAYANDRLYTLATGASASGLVVWVPAADTAAVLRDFRALGRAPAQSEPRPR
jgi:hypothetical protein